MRSSLQHIRLGAMVLGLTLLGSIVGYHYLYDRTWTESVYMVVITISTVGYGETSELSPRQQLFTVAVILLGITAAGYTIGGFLQMLTEGEIQRALGRRRVTHEIEKLRDHVVVCGYGRIGQVLAPELERRQQPFLVIDNDPLHISEANQRGHLALAGDATIEETLVLAQVEHARTLVSALPSDADNLLITLTARSLSSQVQILARAEQPSTQKKLLHAGANRVVMPTAIGAQQFSLFITRPRSADLMELVSDRETLDIELDEAAIAEGCPLDGETIQAVDIRGHYHLLIVAIKPQEGDMFFNPGPEYVFQAGDTLILMGRVEDIARFRKDHAV